MTTHSDIERSELQRIASARAEIAYFERRKYIAWRVRSTRGCDLRIMDERDNLHDAMRDLIAVRKAKAAPHA